MNARLSLIIIAHLLMYGPLCRADTIYLSNGRSLEGFVKSEDENNMEIEVKGGSVKFNKSQIEKIVESTPEEESAIRQRWEKESIEARARMVRQQAEEQSKPRGAELAVSGHNIIVDVLLNRKVEARFVLDTGASYTIITKNIAKKLGIKLDGVKADMTLQVADGRKIDAKHIVIESIRVEKSEAKNVDASVMLDDSVKMDFGDGLLGMSFLKHFNFKIDLKNKKLILEKL